MDVTEDLLRFREAARAMWNVHMRPVAGGPHLVAAWEDWEEICLRLFSSMVSRRLGIDVPVGCRLDLFFDSLIVVCWSGTQIRINRSLDPSPYWDFDFRGEVDRLRMQWGWFFDFGSFGHVEFEFHNVIVVSSESDEGVVGRRALVPVQGSRVFFRSR